MLFAYEHGQNGGKKSEWYAYYNCRHYTKHNYIYMCAKEDFSGTHNFAKTLSEHNANAKRYQQALNKLNIKK